MPLDLLRGDKALRVAFRDISLEVCISNHLSEAGTSSRMTKKTLGEEENKLQRKQLASDSNTSRQMKKTRGFAEVTMDLTTEDMELHKKISVKIKESKSLDRHS